MGGRAGAGTFRPARTIPTVSSSMTKTTFCRGRVYTNRTKSSWLLDARGFFHSRPIPRLEAWRATRARARAVLDGRPASPRGALTVNVASQCHECGWSQRFNGSLIIFFTCMHAASTLRLRSRVQNNTHDDARTTMVITRHTRYTRYA